MAPVSDRVWTVGEVLTWTRTFFERRRIDSPRLTAELLLAHALGCRRIDLYTRFGAPVDRAGRDRFRDLVRRRADERVPVAYLTNTAHFLTITLHVDERVMIPRPETEVLVEALEGRVPPGPVWVVDVGTGCGAVAVAVARRRPAAQVVAIDISADALAVAERNVVEHGFTDRVELIEGDLLGPLIGRQWGPVPVTLLANVPYVSEADLAAAQPEVRDHEPRLALDGGPDGLSVIRRLIDQAPEVCPGEGWLMLEVGAGQADQVAALLRQQAAWTRIDRLRDYAGHERVVAAQRGGAMGEQLK